MGKDGLPCYLSGHLALFANVAQLVEQCFRKAEVKGSNPFIGSRMNKIEMKNYLKTIKKAIFEDYLNLYLLSGSLFIFLVDYFLWKLKLVDKDLYIQGLSGLYPIKYLLVIYVLNSFLALFSYDKEKEISYLLFAANIFIGILILVLEIFYIISLNGYA